MNDFDHTCKRVNGARDVDALAAIHWDRWSTRFLLFTGKGGVGKTTIASATAIALADAGRRVLLVSTDPASNLRDVFEMPTSEQPAAVEAVPGLEIMDIDPHQAADDYRTRVIGPYRDVLPATELAALSEKLAGACTIEVAAFDAFARLVASPTTPVAYDHVIFDTAPTGHTLRLLSLPAAWSEYLRANPDATSCLGPLSGLHDDRPIYAATVDALTDARATTVVLVARPERTSLAVAAVAAAELSALGVARQELIVNGLLTHPARGDAVAEAYASTERLALDAMPRELASLPTSVVPLAAIDMVGASALRRLVDGVTDHPERTRTSTSSDLGSTASMTDLIDEIEIASRGAILVAGKGGVGKTTVATRIALELARRGRRVHLSTTDPAGHAATIADAPDNLTVSVIDPEAATRSYVETRMRNAARQGLDHAHLDLLAEDLRSPCSQEVAVFQAFHHLLGRARNEFVVIDTAPTGHTLLLLDTTGAYHRQSIDAAGQSAGRVITPLMRLQDPKFSKVIIVTLAETTPVSEAAELQDDLRRAGIEPYGWVVNATLTQSDTADPVLNARAELERRPFTRVRSIARRVWTLPWDPAIASTS